MDEIIQKMQKIHPFTELFDWIDGLRRISGSGIIVTPANSTLNKLN